MVFVYATVRENQNVCTVFVCFIYFHKETVNGTVKSGTLIISNRNNCYFKPFYVHVFDFQHVCIGQDRMIDFQYLAVFRLFMKQVSIFSDIDSCTGNDLFTDGIDWRIGNLCKKLFEIIKQRLMFLGKYSQRCINTHSRNTFCAV